MTWWGPGAAVRQARNHSLPHRIVSAERHPQTSNQSEQPNRLPQVGGSLWGCLSPMVLCRRQLRVSCTGSAGVTCSWASLAVPPRPDTRMIRASGSAPRIGSSKPAADAQIMACLCLSLTEQSTCLALPALITLGSWITRSACNKAFDTMLLARCVTTRQRATGCATRQGVSVSPRAAVWAGHHLR